MTQTVGITTGEFAKSRGKELRAIIEARRKGVEFIYAHPDEAASVLSSAYHLPPAVAKDALETNLQKFGKWWSAGNFDMSGMNEVLRAMNMTGELAGSVDWNSMIDQDFLPSDLRRKIP
jgi:NitT/TauT family transport system substrate-binding protein